MALFAPRRIGILGYEGATALDIVGASEVFATALTQGQVKSAPCYDVMLIGLNDRPFRSDSGIEFKPSLTIHSAPVLDTLIIPGGGGIRDQAILGAAARWILRKEARTRRVVSICTGLYALAETGLLDGRSVTTHWRYADDVAARYPNLRVDPNPLFVRDGKFYTAAGVTSGIDLSLALVEEDWGRQVALTVARELVVYLRRSGSQEQFSEPLKFQMQAGDRFSDIAAWIPSNLQQDLSVEALAKKAALCPRHFRRRFKLTFGKNPGTYVECLRLGEVRRRLATTHQTVDAIATSVGFGSADSLRRVFRRHYGTAPAEYRERFNPTNGHSPARAKARAI